MISSTVRATAAHDAATTGSHRRTPDARTRSIWLTQLALAASVVVTSLVVQALTPGRITSWTFTTGVAVILGITMVALASPWRRLSRDVVLVIPLVDLVGIGLMAAADDLRLSFLWVFPVTWLATHFSLGALASGLSMIVAIMLADATLSGGSDTVALRVTIVTLCLTFIGLTAHATARQTRAFKRLLRGQTARMQNTLERVSEQERSVSLMLNAIDVGIVRLSAHGELLAVNDTYARLYGIDPGDPSHPARAVEYFEREGRALPEQARPLVRAAAGEAFDDERVWLFDAAGNWRALSVASRLVDGGETEPPSRILIVHDVTALIESERARQQIASVVSHELRNPLTAVIGHAELGLEQYGVPTAIRRKFETIHRAGERMERMLAEVLQRPAGPAPDREKAAVDLRSIVESSLESFAPAAAARGVDVRLEAPVPLPVAGDGFRLRQVIDNLVSNAIKYTPRDGLVRVVCGVDGDRATVELSDTGIGIAPEDLPHVFDPYFRAGTALESRAPGTGLGMGIAREIVSAHEGTLEVASDLGTGTTVTLCLPASKVEAPA